jgi:tRNA(fMet)-specific endonuclease VapC
MRYMLDSNIVIELLRKAPERLVRRLNSYSEKDIGISTIVLAELEFGVLRSGNPTRNRRAVDLVTEELAIIPFDEAAAVEYGKVRLELEERGKVIGPLDMLIAAHARSAHVTLVTNNLREFQRVAALRVESW